MFEWESYAVFLRRPGQASLASASDFERQKLFTPYTSVSNVTGQPAISLPLHVGAGGLPDSGYMRAKVAQERLVRESG